MVYHLLDKMADIHSICICMWTSDNEINVCTGTEDIGAQERLLEEFSNRTQGQYTIIVVHANNGMAIT